MVNLLYQKKKKKKKKKKKNIYIYIYILKNIINIPLVVCCLDCSSITLKFVWKSLFNKVPIY